MMHFYDTYYMTEREFESESQYSNQDDYYIKKHINAVQRGDSAIFGDPLSKEKNEIILPSPSNSYQEEEDDGEVHSRVDPFGKPPQHPRQPSENYSEEEEKLAELMGIKQPKKEEERVEQPHPDSHEVPPQHEAQQDEESPVNIDTKPQDGLHQEQQQPIIDHPYPSQNNESSESVQSPIQPVAASPSEQERLRLKEQRMRYWEAGNGQVELVLEGVRRNTESIETAYRHILDQNTMLAQFKEDASRKLEDNIKTTLREKMNEINRENSKEIKDIKNLTANVHELLLKHDQRIQTMEKGIEEVLKLLRNGR